MSKTTGVMLLCSLVEESAIPEIQQWLIDNHNQQLNEISDRAGGAKTPGFEAWCGGIKYLPHDEDTFPKLVLSRTWNMPEVVVLILQPEEGSARVFRPNRSLLAPLDVNAEEVGRQLFDFLNGTSNAVRWHYFINTPIEDEQLENIRLRAKAVASAEKVSDLDTLRALLEDVERLRLGRGGWHL